MRKFKFLIAGLILGLFIASVPIVSPSVGNIVARSGKRIGTMVTGGLHAIWAVTVSLFHHEQHEGRAFISTFRVPLGNNEVTSLAFCAPPSDRYAHAVFSYGATSEAEFYLYKNATATTGLAREAVNTNSSSGLSALASLCWVEGNIVATEEPWDYAIAGSGNQRGGNVGPRNERICVTGLISGVSIVSRSASNIVWGWVVWYEAEPEEAF